MAKTRLAFYIHPDDAPALSAIVAQLNAAREAQKSPFKGGPYRAMADVKIGDTITDIDGQPRTVCKFSNADTTAGQIPWPMATAGRGKPAPIITGDFIAAARNNSNTPTGNQPRNMYFNQRPRIHDTIIPIPNLCNVN
jgi:hypothetical protein